MRTMTFDELCRNFNVNADERDKLAWHLGAIRARKTYDELRLESGAEARYKQSLLYSLRRDVTQE